MLNVKRNSLGIIIYAVMFVSMFSHMASACELKMGYKDGAKGVLIGAVGDDSGAYYDLFEEAARRIDCNLIIVRQPKRRLHESFKKGELDFYPGTSFSLDRSEYLYFFDNGFLTREVGISRAELPSITGISQMRGLRVLAEVGSAKASIEGVEAVLSSTLSFDRVVKMIRRGRADIYIADVEYVRDYLIKKTIESIESIGLKVHPDCCGGDCAMYVGFSRESPHYGEVKNMEFQPDLPVSPDNQPVTLRQGTIAHCLATTLLTTKKEGLAQKIYFRDFNDRSSLLN